jgi:hypothetical protein
MFFMLSRILLLPVQLTAAQISKVMRFLMPSSALTGWWTMMV